MRMLPPDIPIPSIAEVQRALRRYQRGQPGCRAEEVKQRLRTGIGRHNGMTATGKVALYSRLRGST